MMNIEQVFKAAALAKDWNAIQGHIEIVRKEIDADPFAQWNIANNDNLTKGTSLIIKLTGDEVLARMQKLQKSIGEELTALGIEL